MINKRLIDLMGEAKKYIAWHLIIQIANLALNIAAIFFMADIIQKAYQKTITKEDIITLCIAFLVIIVLRFRFNILLSQMSYYASGRVKQTLREKMYSKLLTLGSRYKEKFSTSEIVQISMEGVDQLETYFGRYLPQFFYSMIAPIVLFAVLSTVSLKASVILLICVPLIPLSIVAIVKIAKKFLEDVQGLTTLKIYKADEKKNEEMNIEAEKFRIATMNLLFMQLNSTTIMDIIAYGGAALGVIISILEYMKGNINLAGTFTIIMLSAEFFIPLRLLGSFFHIAMNGISASDKMFEILDMEEDKNRINKINKDNEEIIFNNVSFAYNEDKTILKNINLNIKEKSFVSIVGVSGSGKSTIAGLISLKNENYKGSIKIGDIELSTIDKDDLYKKIVITERKMNEVLKKVELYDFLQTEDGLNTKIMEKASNLSGGQKQRLALARAILFNADIYIFDEATSNVDVESEESIMEVIRDVESEESIMEVIRDIAREKTVILISHRLYNCIPSDKIYFLKDGVIEEEGTHNELMSINGEYARIFNEQTNLESITKGESLSIAIGIKEPKELHFRKYALDLF